MASKTVLLVTGDFVEGLECYFAQHALEMFGYVVHSVCPGKKAGEAVSTAVHDFDGYQTYSEKRGHNYPMTHDFDDVKGALEGYSGLFIPGGRAPEYLRLNEDVLSVVRFFNDKKLPIASLCHGPQLLLSAGILKGRTCTSYCAVYPDLTMGGANLVQTDYVADGHIHTAKDWSVQAQLLAGFVKAMGSTMTH
mmetsp:Transcript_20052/g.62040  ORF Transcript_20052/g.62040 Transcript_20052/m.62040 type:complete len:193 (+) Transcript_20052:21-599(+)